MKKSYHIGQQHVNRFCYVCQPSSIAAERVFSLLKNSFSEQQSSALEDNIELLLMLQYNNHNCLLCFFEHQNFQLCKHYARTQLI